MADENRVQEQSGATQTASTDGAVGSVQRSPHGGPAGPGGARRQRPAGTGGRKYFRRKKVCKFQVEKIDHISYRDVPLLRQFISEKGKILPARLTGTSPCFQRKLTKAIKQARNIALLPFATRF